MRFRNAATSGSKSVEACADRASRRKRDLVAQADYFDAQGGTVLEDRFLTECDAGFERLSQFPESGTLVRHRHFKIEGCRFILVPGFEKILIFYKVLPERIEIVRVLHGARDIEEALN